MYKSFFGLAKNPFNSNPDPSFLYMTPRLQATLAELTYGIESRQGCTLLTGEVGTGKTTLVNHLLLWLRQRGARTAFIFNSHLTTRELLDFVVADFGIALDQRFHANPLIAFNDWLVERYRAKELVVLVVDEAQGLPTASLEEIRMLMNLEMPHEKLLQIVLCGQPELDAKLKRPELRQLQQRIGVRCKTHPLTLQEAHQYIHNRLRIAGAAGASVFTPQAIDAIHFYARGIPRLMNLLCENVLINAYVQHIRPVTPSIVEESALDLELEDNPATRFATESKPEDLVYERFSCETPADLPPNTLGEQVQRSVPAKAEAAAPALQAPRPAGTKQNETVYAASVGNARSQVKAVAALSISPLPATLKTDNDVSSTHVGSGLGPEVSKRFEPSLRPAEIPLPVKPKISPAPGVAQKSYDWAWLSYFELQNYGKAALASGSMGVLLFALTQRLGSGTTAHFAAQTIAGFFGLLLCAISLGAMIASFLQAKSRPAVPRVDRLRAAQRHRWTTQARASVRWLRQPMRAAGLRERRSVSGRA
ncbi:MAG: hypothetical protein NVS9B4_11810 [Candidatus Acidiferrum sp.]